MVRNRKATLMKRTPVRASDLRGAVRLATAATTGLVDLVEAMHERIARVPGFSLTKLDGRTGGITGLVYKTIRGVTRVTGGSIEALLSLLAPALGEGQTGAERNAIVAVLNGVLGDYLAASFNPLATPMAFRRDGRPLALETSALAAALPEAGARVLVLLHGLCTNDRQWSRDGHDHGAALARDLGFSPVYLHYNSGLHISINGRLLADRLELLLSQWPRPVERFALLGHSMGGLLARSALHYGTQADHRWPEKTTDMVFLGTPHHGAPLERAGHWIDIVLGATLMLRRSRAWARCAAPASPICVTAICWMRTGSAAIASRVALIVGSTCRYHPRCAAAQLLGQHRPAVRRPQGPFSWGRPGAAGQRSGPPLGSQPNADLPGRQAMGRLRGESP